MRDGIRLAIPGLQGPSSPWPAGRSLLTQALAGTHYHLGIRIMTVETIDVFCPRCNILVGARIRAEVRGGFRTDALSDIDLPDFEYHGEHYILALCGRCNGPFLIRQSLFGIPESSRPLNKKGFFTQSSTGSLSTICPLSCIKHSIKHDERTGQHSMSQPP